MSEVKPSAFSFKSFRIIRSVLNFGIMSEDDFKIGISPKGEYNKSTKIYTLVLDVKVSDNMNSEVINVISESKFEFDEEITDEVPKYFTLNAPAITFPYIRAYISALSALSGVGPMNVPILNL